MNALARLRVLLDRNVPMDEAVFIVWREAGSPRVRSRW